MIWHKLTKKAAQEHTLGTPFICVQCEREYGAEKKHCPLDGGLLVPKKQPQSRAHELSGRVLAERYYINAIRGEGGMSIVYSAQHTMMDRPVAIKILKNFESSQDKMLKRFQQEARAASSLNHPNLITLFDFGITAEGLAYIVMEFLEGQSLETLIETEVSLDHDRTAKIFLQVCDGLEHAHSKGIVHRDIKPSNIILLPSAQGDLVKIVDFGIAKLLPEANKQTFHLTQADMVFGSPFFMSPEQCANSSVDARTDVYAVGATMYNALAGRPPFDAPTLAEVIYSHLRERPKTIKEIAPWATVSDRLEEVVMRCLEKEPEARYQSMAELRTEIAAACGSRKTPERVRPTFINVVIAEDSDERASLITESLIASEGINVVARAKRGEEAIDKVMQHYPQAVLVDVQLPGMDGTEVARQLKECSPNIRIMLFTCADDHNALIKALSAGADGYIFRDLSPNRLGPAIKAIANGIPWIDPEITSRVLRQSAHNAAKTDAPLDTSTKTASNERMDHPEYLDKLAQVYMSEKKYDEAEALLHGSIALNEKARGKDCAELAPTLTRLADLYMSRQKSAAAEQMYLRALHIRLQSLGQEHLDVAASLENLALLFKISGGYAEAERFYLWALQIRHKMNDRSDHSKEALSTAYQQLSAVYTCMNRSEEADDMLRRANRVRTDPPVRTQEEIPAAD